MSIDFSPRKIEVQEPAGNTEDRWFRSMPRESLRSTNRLVTLRLGGLEVRSHDKRTCEVHEPAGDAEARWFRGSLPM